MGYVYVITHTNAEGLFKIGITRQPINRIAQLGGDNVTVHCMMLSQDPEETERDLHAHFREQRVPQSEWFRLTKEHLEEVFHRLELEHEQVISHVIKPDLTTGSGNRTSTQFPPIKPKIDSSIPRTASLPPPIPTPTGEPEWDRDYQKWRYTDKDGLERESDSYQEALNNK